MSNRCPKCGSIRVVKLPSGDVNICLACESFLNTINGKASRTVFDRITASPEVLAEDMVYEIGAMWASTLIVDTTFETYEEAIAATVEKLKEVFDE